MQIWALDTLASPFSRLLTLPLSATSYFPHPGRNTGTRVFIFEFISSHKNVTPCSRFLVLIL
jgi:hypothetical protein